MNSLLTAVRTLTVCPLPADEPFTGADALVWFPAVGAVLGGLLYGLATGGEALLEIWAAPWPEGLALLILAAQYPATGALHLDGLADWADARAGRDRTERLSIMADSMVGTFGMLAIVFSVLIRFVALSRLISAGLVVWLVPVLMTARAGQVHLCVRCASARNSGAGAGFVEGARATHWIVAIGATFLVQGIWFGVPGIVVGAAGLLIGEEFGRRNTAQLGGVTGDVIGACNEWIEVLLLAGLAAVVDLLPDSFPLLAQLFG